MTSSELRSHTYQKKGGPTHHNSVNPIMGVKEWGLIFFLSVVWGGSFFFVEVAVKEMTPLTVVLCRVGFASIILLVVVTLKGKKMPVSLGQWGAFFIMGALNNLIPFSLIVWGQTHIDSSLASILNATTPIFSVVLAHFLTREEQLTLNRMAGILIGWLGVTVLIGIESLKGFGVEVFGQIAVLGAGFQRYGSGCCCYRHVVWIYNHDDPNGFDHRAAVESESKCYNLGGPVRTFSYQHILGIHYLFSGIGHRRCHESLTGDLFSPSERNLVGCHHTWRATGVECIWWDGTHLSGFDSH
jgi:hypothetical protein